MKKSKPIGIGIVIFLVLVIILLLNYVWVLKRQNDSFFVNLEKIDQRINDLQIWLKDNRPVVAKNIVSADGVSVPVVAQVQPVSNAAGYEASKKQAKPVSKALVNVSGKGNKGYITQKAAAKD